MVSQLIDTNQGSPTQHAAAPPGQSYFDKKWTLEEYEAELRKPIDHPDPNNVEDPRYYMKYAINIPPPAAYYFLPDKKDQVATNEETKNDRRVYFGWDNLTQFEKDGMNQLKAFLAQKGCTVPPSFEERDWLKWI